ncbi:hypothetical protein GALMADRAFT_151335 [Galerina marginata CBS 339.88]|uniref:Uncharacterized protein n=1 Tax=Galerina marginata (strain CBS 339.88) TaxID=685588 RepID=A0A067TWY1_GALM3|nr:hypothetical protein GALMADRAFT_151335 [Galerina marginata CBS 339.88]
MPQIYAPNPLRRRSSSSASSSSSSSSSTTALRPIDADDSIVLSDLVRTGEASRLRRRGAMRIDPALHSVGSARTPSVVIVDRQTWDAEYEFDLASLHEPSGRTASLRLPHRRQRSTRRYGPYASGSSGQHEVADEYVYSLVCGQKIHGYDSDDFEAFKPSVLPVYPATHRPEREINRSTGCGSLVHVRAAPRPRVGVWTAYSAASSIVVPLDAGYFDACEAAKFARSSCGCTKEGIGCAVCGNPLGTRYTPCKSAADTFFCSRNNEKSQPSASSSHLRGPEGPQYWQPSSPRGSDHTIYTFFSNAVTSTPTYEFPAPKARTRPRLYSDASLHIISSPPLASRGLPSDPSAEFFSDDEEEDEAAVIASGGSWHSGPTPPADGSLLTPRAEGDSAEAILFDRLVTASPTPLSDVGEESSHLIPPRVYSHARRPRIYPDDPVPAPVSFYQQQVIGAWERERERQRERTASPGFDPDGESFVWGVADPEEPGSPDKSYEHFLFPER